MFESKSGIMLVAGLIFFGFAFVSNAVVPIIMYQDLPEKTVEELVEVNGNLRYQFEDLAKRYPESFEKVYGKRETDPNDPSVETKWWNKQISQALRVGRKVYVGEGCWHCHSQFVRPVSNESKRWGPVATSKEFQNELQRPVMFGTRRVGPDLSHEGGRRSNDWHAVHFFRPLTLSAKSPMPEYPWFFDGAPDKPNERGFAIITYVQWLGSWLESYPYYEDYVPAKLASDEDEDDEEEDEDDDDEEEDSDEEEDDE